MNTKSPNKTLFTFLIVIGLFLLSFNLVSADIILEDQGTEFIVNDAPTQTYSTDNTKQSNSISAENIYIQTVSDISAISCHFVTQSVYITNNNADPITTTIESNKEFVSFNKYSTFVMPGETNEILMYVRAPCGKEIDTTQTLTFISNNNIEHSLKQDISSTQISNIGGSFDNIYAQSCPTNTLTYKATISNPAPFSDTYEIKAVTDESYVSITPNSFVLGPSETKDITVFITYDKSIYGERKVPVEITTKNNQYKSTITLTADMEQCYNFALAGPETISVCEDGFVKETIFNITNYAAFSNEYDLSITDKPSFVELPGDYISLKSNQSGQILITAEPNTKTFFELFEQSRAGNYSMTLVAESAYGDVIAQKDIIVDVQACYDHAVISGETFEVCSADEGLPFSISNDGLFEETYELLLESSNPAAVYLENRDVTVDAGKTVDQIVYFKQANITGDFDISVTATIKNNSKVSESVNIKLEKQTDKTCYDVKVTPGKWNIDKEENVSEYVLPISIVNNGIRDNNYSLYMSDVNDFVTINETHVYLRSEEARELLLTATITNTTPNGAAVFVVAETYDYTKSSMIKVYYENNFPWWILLLLLLLIIMLLVVLVTKKSNNKKTRKQKVEKIKEAKPKTKKETVKEKRKAKKETKKEQKKSGLWWILLLILLLIAILFVAAYLLSDSNDTNNTGNESISNQTQENDTVPVNETSGNQTSTSFVSQVADWWNSLFESQNTTAMNYTENQTQEDPIAPINTTDTSNMNQTQSNQTSLLESFANWFNSLFSYGNIANNTTTNETQQNETTAVEPVSQCPEVAEMKAFIAKNNLTNNFTYQIIPKNAIFEIDLSTLFVDPDNDSLTYQLVQPENITVTVINSTGYIIPDDDFCGVRTTTIIAQDPDGAIATSPEITLIIDEKADLTTYFVSMQGLIILSTVLIIAMIVALLLWLKE